MVEQSGDVAEIEEEAPPPRRRRRWPRRLALALLLILALGWFNRESIVDRIVSGQLKELGLPGRYTIESAGASRQVLTDIVIGDPAHPDLTVEKAVVEIEDYYFATSQLAQTTLRSVIGVSMAGVSSG